MLGHHQLLVDGSNPLQLAIFNSYVTNYQRVMGYILAVVIPIFDSFGRQIDMFEKHQIPVAFCQEKP